MHSVSPQILFALETIIFISIVMMHLVKKNVTAIWLYVIQSLAVVSLLIISSFERVSVLLAITILATILVKVVVAPIFFKNLINRHQLRFSSSTYLNTPLTLLVIGIIIILSQIIFQNIAFTLSPAQKSILLIATASILISIFLLINRKGALSQMLGILSIENSIVSFAIFAGLEQNPALQLGILFNIAVWVVIASVFASMIYKHFGTMDVTDMKNLTE